MCNDEYSTTTISRVLKINATKNINDFSLRFFDNNQPASFEKIKVGNNSLIKTVFSADVAISRGSVIRF